jgi:hypothetical protein
MLPTHRSSQYGMILGAFAEVTVWFVLFAPAMGVALIRITPLPFTLKFVTVLPRKWRRKPVETTIELLLSVPGAISSVVSLDISSSAMPAWMEKP